MSNKSYYSSITKKIIMSLMGLFLLTFLVVHLTVNSFLLVSKDLFNEGAHFMGTNAFIQVFQWVLFAGFAIHIFYGIVLQIQNWMSRPKGYKKRAAMEQSPFSKYMIYTGLVIFIFLIMHLNNFFFVKMGWVGHMPMTPSGEEDMGALVMALFHNGYYVFIYVVLILLMGFHLDHALQSAFQTLGLNHPTYWGFIKGLSRAYAIVVALGFAIIPLFIYFFK
ncbi:MAG: succinate dehydrogenase cytochrome b subunit [Bacteroidales bacterium]|nr:succinate dehydrogenase cytochrome b subunit [Bacteroidales bacterium]